MNKIFLFIFLIFLFSNCEKKEKKTSNGINLNNSYTIKVEKKLPIKKYDTLHRNSMIAEASKFFENKEIKKYYLISKKIEKLSLENKDFEGNIQAKLFLATYFNNDFKLDSAFYYYKQAEKLSIKIKAKPFIVSIYLGKTDILLNQHDYSSAEKQAIKALKIASTKKDYDDLILACYLRIGNALEGMEKNENALNYYKKAFLASKKIENNFQKRLYLSMIQNFIARILEKNKEYKNLIKYINQNVNLDDIKKIEIKVYCYLKNRIGYSRLKLGDTTSKSNFLETLKIADSINFSPIKITSKTHLGEYFLIEKDTLKANKYFLEAQVLAHNLNVFEDELKILQLLAKANPAKATFYNNRYIVLSDSLQTVERATRDKFARIEFETDQITTDKKNLTEEKEVLSLQRWMIAAISLFLIVIIVLWFKNNAQKAKTRELLLKQEQQKANEEIYQLMLDQQQKIEEGKNLEKQRISLELHDGVMGKLSAVRLNLYASLYKANLIDEVIFSKQIDEIQAVEQEIRTIAHDLNSNLLSDSSNFIAIVKELFARIENHSNIQFTLTVSDAVNWEVINNIIKINLYRILQEALQNIEKYAEAKKVVISMNKTKADEIAVTILDDGNGFNMNQKKDGIGIKNMKIRIAELNGTFNIASEIKKGTKINLIIPF